MGMAIVLSDISAALFWESQSLEGPHAPRRVMSPPDCGAPTARDVERARNLLAFLPCEPLHVLVGSRLDRRWHPGIVAHSCTKELPTGSFFSIGEGMFIASPELTFIQLARRLPIEHLIHFAMMLCGVYAREPALRAMEDGCPEPLFAQRRRLSKRAALITVDDLRSYVNELRGVQGRGLKGVQLAIQALPHVIGRSRSPMESALSMALCLPHRLGGFALPQPTLNSSVYLADKGNLAGGVRWDSRGLPYFECDLVWQKQRVIVEYHGDDGHFTREGVARDARKANILLGEGYSYYVATLDSMSASKFPEFAHRIRLDLHRKFQTTVKDFEHRGERLRAMLRQDYLLGCRLDDCGMTR